MSLDRLVNMVCNRLLNNPIDVRERRVVEPKRDAKPFNLSDYDILRFNPREKDTQRKHYPYFKERGINMRTQFAFHKQFFLATRHRTDGLSLPISPFPFRYHPSQTASLDWKNVADPDEKTVRHTREKQKEATAVKDYG